MKTKFFNALSLAVIMAMLITSLALADDLYNLLDNDIDNTKESVTITAGGSVSVGFKIRSTSGGGDVAGCNVDNDNKATLIVTPPAGVTVSDPVVFSACDQEQEITFFSTTPDTYDINSSDFSLSGGKNGSKWATTTAQFKLIVNPAPSSDTTPPVIDAHDDITAEATSALGAIVGYTAPATTDDVDGTGLATCVPASGSQFALGDTTVYCDATDTAGNVAEQTSFVVHVVDTTPPTLVGMPSDMIVEGNKTGGADVSFTDPTATDIVDANPSVSCVPASGSFFALGGPHAVTCTATDASSNFSSDSFDVTVVDTTPPSLTCPVNISGTVGQVVVLGSPIVSDIVDASPTVGNNAPTSFGPGTTNVTWTAEDGSGNSASCSQSVTLKYIWLGFFQPVDNLPTVNKAKAGQGIPFKWALKDANGNYISDLSTVLSYGYGTMACNGAAVDTIESYDTTGASGLRYDPIANQFIFTSKTDKLWAGSCKTFTLYLNDGTMHQANFNFTK